MCGSGEGKVTEKATQSTVVTPITQALQEGVITRSELKALMARNNRTALGWLLAWIAVLCVTSTLVWLSLGTWWLLPAMFVHGIVLVHHFSLQHECCHYTVFRTRWLNDVVGYVCGLVIILPNRFFRYEHCDHHTYTQISGRDPEMIEMPQSWRQYLWYISSIPYWRAKITEIFTHAFGKLLPNEARFIPREERNTIFLEARLMLGLYALVMILALAFQSWAPLWFWLFPVMLGEPVMRAIRMTEHVGRPTTKLMRENTRSNLVSLPWRFLCWNMNYHAEHHYAPSVPFHALPRLHKKLQGVIHLENDGYIGAHRDIIQRLPG